MNALETRAAALAAFRDGDSGNTALEGCVRAGVCPHGGVRARGPRPGARGRRRARPEQNLASVRSGAGDRAAIGHQDAPPRGKGRERRPRTPPERGHQGDRRGAEPPLASSNVARHALRKPHPTTGGTATAAGKVQCTSGNRKEPSMGGTVKVETAAAHFLFMTLRIETECSVGTGFIFEHKWKSDFAISRQVTNIHCQEFRVQEILQGCEETCRRIHRIRRRQ